jgi:hypothetical protein
MMQAFRDCLMDCDLHDMGFTGDKFTLRREEIGQRLDRAVCNNEWRERLDRDCETQMTDVICSIPSSKVLFH